MTPAGRGGGIMGRTTVVTREDGGGLLYAQIVDALRADIAERLRPGDAIAPQTELERRFGVSRITVRRAIDELVQAGLVVRRQGSGTFVARPKVTEELGVLHGWTDGMRAQGLTPRTVDCDILEVVPPAWVAQVLRLEARDLERVIRIQRLRYADNEPLCVMVDYLRLRFVPHLVEDGLSGESLYETLMERYGLDLAVAEDTVTARGASVFEARLLGVAENAHVLYVTRVTYLPDDEPLGVATVVSRADRYEYRVAGRPRRHPMRP